MNWILQTDLILACQEQGFHGGIGTCNIAALPRWSVVNFNL